MIQIQPIQHIIQYTNPDNVSITNIIKYYQKPQICSLFNPIIKIDPIKIDLKAIYLMNKVAVLPTEYQENNY